MAENDPGLDLHDWETRRSELEEQLGDDPAATLPDACDFVERVLSESGIDVEGVGGEHGELLRGYEAARETADRIERGEDVDLGDVGAAVENLRTVYATLLTGGQT